MDPIFELALKFCEPIVDDAVLADPQIDVKLYKDLLIERNSVNFCAWAKCTNRVHVGLEEKNAIFCSQKCQFMSQQFAASLVQDKKGPIGRVVEKFAEQKPPKPLKKSAPDEVEGFKIRVGPYRHILNDIERWFGGFRVFSFKGMSPEQTQVFDCVNECLKEIGSQLMKNSQEIVQFFCNINVTEPKTLLEAPKPVRMAFALAIYEYLTDAEVQPALPEFQIDAALYEDIWGIVCSTDAGDY